MSNFDQRNQNIDKQTNIAGEVGKLVVEGDVYINSRPVKKKSSRFIIEMAIGMLLPPFACLITFTAYTSRFYMKGIWTTGVLESILTVVALFGLFVLSAVLFIVGTSRLGQAAVSAAGKFKWKNFSKSLQDGKERISKYLSEHPNRLEAIKNLPQAFKSYLNVDMTDFNERLIAIVLSLFVPGLGLLYRGRIWFGILSFVFTVVGYFAEFFPGLLLHLLVIITSGLIEKSQKVTTPSESQPT